MSSPDPAGLGATGGLDLAIARLDALLAPPGPLLVISDFDGTLAPIVPEPMGARIVPLARTALRRLARIGLDRPDRLAVVVLSGRQALDVAGRVRVGGIRYVGNHGLEIGDLAPRGRAERLAIETDEAMRSFVGPAARLAEAVPERLGRPDWLFVEAKGPSVSFHYRAATDPDAAASRIRAAVAAHERDAGASGLVPSDGRRVVEYRPAEAGAKGAATRRLIERLRPPAVLVLGDDRSDAEAFEVVRAARARDGLRALIVAVHGATETPAEVLAAADVVLAEPREAAILLASLARAATSG